MIRTLLTITALAGLCVSNALADPRPSLDKDFVTSAIPQCHAIALYADLAETRSRNEEVKAFARKLLKEHQGFGELLAKAASVQKVSSVVAIEKSVRDEVDRLSKLQGAEFDRAFLKRVIADHEACIGMCEKQLDKGTDLNTKDLARTCSGKLREHLKEAQALFDKVK